MWVVDRVLSSKVNFPRELADFGGDLISHNPSSNAARQALAFGALGALSTEATSKSSFRWSPSESGQVNQQRLKEQTSIDYPS